MMMVNASPVYRAILPEKQAVCLNCYPSCPATSMMHILIYRGTSFSEIESV